MINDNNVTIHELGCRPILKARQESEETSRRQESFSNLKYQKSISRLKTTLSSFHWERDHQRTKPPITMAISKEEFFAWIKH